MGTQGTGRKRSTKKERTTAEDDALDLIAREAEARLAAKRAARAEAREIRMKELERQQKEIFQVQKKYYDLNPKPDDVADRKWGDIEQWMEDSERYSRSSRMRTLSDDDERMSVGSRSSVRSSSSHKKSKKKKKHKHKDRDASYASSDLYGLNGLSSSRHAGSTLNGYQSSLYDDGLGSRRVTGSSSHPLEYTNYVSSSSRASSRASSARASPVENCGSVASFLRSTASSGVLPRDLDDVTIPDFSDVDDKEYLEKGSRAASALTAATLSSVGGTSSRRGSGETAGTVDADTSIREIKEIHELKDQIQDVETKYTQNLKEAKEALAEVEEKYRKAMVSNAQLDNEKTNLIYQVDTLKDSLMELEELLSESRREFEEKVKECEREKYGHSVLQFQFNELKETLKQSEELLNESRQLRMKQDGFVREISDLQETLEWKDKKIGALERQKEYTDAIRVERDELREEVVKLKDVLKKHGIVLGPDLTVNGDIGEAEVDGLPSGDAAPTPAQVSQTSPVEGKSMLGNAEENQLRSSIKEEVQQEQHQESWTEESKQNNLSSDALCSLAGVSSLKTSSETPSTKSESKNQQITSPTDANTEESKDLNIGPVREAKDKIICSPELEEIVRAEENIPEKETLGSDLKEINNPYVEEENKSADDTEAVQAQEDRKEAVEESDLKNKLMDHQQNAKGSLNESAPAPSNAESQQEMENVCEEENSETEELASKTLSKSQDATTSGKKKKRKRRGKKKGSTQEDKSQQKDEVQKEDKARIDVELDKGGNGSTKQCKVDSANKGLKDQKLGQSKTEQTAETQQATEPKMDHTDQTLETRTLEGTEEVSLTETQAHTHSPQETRTRPLKNEQDDKELAESKGIDRVQSAVRDQCPETISTHDFCESPEASSINQAGNEQQEQEREGLTEAETVDSTGCKDDETTMTNDQSLKPETVEEVEVAAATETSVHAERTVITPCGVSKDEQDEEQNVKRDTVETLEDSLSMSSLFVSSEMIGSGASPDKESPSSLNTCNNGEAEPGRAEIKPACITSNTETKPVTNSTESTDRKCRDPSSGDAPADELEFTHSQTVGLEGSELPLESSVAISDSARECEEAAETVKEQEMKIEQEWCLYSHDDRNPEIEDRMEKRPEDAACHRCNAEEEEEAVAEIESQTASDESNVWSSPETDGLIAANPTDSPREEAHLEQESSLVIESQQKNCRNDGDCETTWPLNELLHSTDSSQPIEQDGDGGCCEDEEGQSFDFDDMDVETAVASHVSRDLDQEEAEDAVEVVADESHSVVSVSGRSYSEPDENTQEKPVKARDEKHEAEVGPQEKNLHDLTEGITNSLPQETKPEKKENVADEEGKVINDVNAQNMKQAASVSADEASDAIRHEMQKDALVLPKSDDQGEVSRELLQAGKDGKKSSKKGKGKSKEECKMS
ncbi:retinitis pigmentosa 1-like 1 protein isoform X5 [Betta splendens]|uniref:Retinitis pigmentosa 1-like 1 protein isoform X5 n=1 Tax=Betta splendens TaxID=158456 RepID=A0A6P7LDZ9_BETSP|nr:retinitis pigmentosa 1-like 1 protein isoform X5 [Betta splendens]